MRNTREKMQVFFDEADKLMASEHSLKNIFEISTDLFKKNTVFIFKDADDKRCTVKYSEYRRLCYCAAASIKELLREVPEQSFVGLQLENSPRWVYIFWGLLIAGYKPLLINPITSVKDAEALLEDAGAKAIISHKETKFLTVKPELVSLAKQIDEPVWADEVAFCSSGTTGKPKINVYDGENLTYQIYAAWIMPETSMDICYNWDLRLISIVPFSHIFGFVAVLFWFTFFGRTIVFPKSNAPEHLSECCKKEKISHIFAVPLFWNKVASSFNASIKKESEKKQNLVNKMIAFNLKEKTAIETGFPSSKLFRNIVQKKILGNKVKFCIAGGSVMSKDTLSLINGLGYNLYNGYGMTEIGVTSVELSPDVTQRVKGAVGKPLTNVEYKILKHPNGSQELLVKAPQIHKGTLSKGVFTPTEFDKDGFYHTDDNAYVDENGYYYISGKNVDMIVIGANGENINPDEIETYFQKLPNVEQYSVLGLPSIEGTKLSLVLEVGSRLDEDSIKQLKDEITKANDMLPVAKKIQGVYLSTTPIPINASMKVMRYKIIDDFKHRPETFIRLDSKQTVSFEQFDEAKVNEIKKHVTEIFADILNKKVDEVPPEAHLIIDLGGDSFSYMSIIASVEFEFQIKIPTDMIGKLNSVNQFTLYILNQK